jgi:hypothetical protein
VNAADLRFGKPDQNTAIVAVFAAASLCAALVQLFFFRHVQAKGAAASPFCDIQSGSIIQSARGEAIERI